MDSNYRNLSDYILYLKVKRLKKMVRRDEIRHNYKEFNYSNTLQEKSAKFDTWTIILGFAILTFLLISSLIYLTDSFLNLKRPIPLEVRSIEIFLIVIGLSGLILLNMSIWAVKKQIEINHDQDLQYKKVEKAMMYISDWNNQKLALLTEKINSNFKGLQAKNIASFINENSSFEDELITVLNFLEQIAISIEYGWADQGILLQHFEVIIVKIFSSFEFWINDQRRTKQERLYNSLEKLYYKLR